jgi:hypothetical protein
LENAWLGQVDEPDFRLWYIVAAQGGSLYKHAAHAYMSKFETHHFLCAPDVVDCSRRAFWYAFAHAQVGDRNIALRITRTKLTERSPQCAFWKDVARLFARGATSIPEMNDLVDFLVAAREEDEAFSLAGRSLPALRRHMEYWHRTLRELKIVFGSTWQGVPLANAEYVANGLLGRAVWRFKQIKSEYDLFKEGERLHHCVLSYKELCVLGGISIWSLRCEYPPGKINRGLTLELRGGDIVQCRGFANRLAYPEEAATIKRWAGKHGLSWRALGL